MLLKIYALQDMKQGEFSTIHYGVNDLEAFRYYKMISKDGLLHDFPGDFNLYTLGTIDTKMGVITPEVNALSSLVDVIGDGSNEGNL